MFLPTTFELKKTLKRAQGFTLIELLVVIGILAVLLAIVLIAVNPPRQFILARNTQRRSDALAILNGVGQFFAEEGRLPTNIATGSAQPISSTGPGNADICSDLVDRYLAELPSDPDPDAAPAYFFNTCGDYDSGYTITRTTGNRVTVSAPNSEDPDGGPTGPTISVTR